MSKYASLTVIAVLSALTVLPVVIGFPTRIGRPGSQHDITFLLIGIVLLFDLGMLAFAFKKSADARKCVLRTMARLAAISLSASILLGLDVRIPVIEIPTPHVLAPLLQVDGEYAYDADVFEIYCELWLFVAALFGVAMLVLRHRKRSSLIRREEPQASNERHGRQ
jgi:hypothetical protein